MDDLVGLLIIGLLVCLVVHAIVTPRRECLRYRPEPGVATSWRLVGRTLVPVENTVPVCAEWRVK